MSQKLLVALGILLTLAACGDDSEASPGPGAPFIGTWTTTTATQTVFDCLLAKKQENVAISYSVTKGDGADLLIKSSVAPECPLKANVSGMRATVLPNQSCTRQDSMYKDTYTYATRSTFDLPDAGMGMLKLEATFKRETLAGLDTGYECGFTEESAIKKN